MQNVLEYRGTNLNCGSCSRELTPGNFIIYNTVVVPQFPPILFQVQIEVQVMVRGKFSSNAVLEFVNEKSVPKLHVNFLHKADFPCVQKVKVGFPVRNAF